MRKLVLLPLIFVALSASSQQLSGDSVFIKRISNNILSSGEANDNLWYLCKKIGARLSGSPQMVKAENWGLAIFHKYGGPNSAWLQECMVPHWVRGGRDTATATCKINGKTQVLPLHVLALGNSLGTGTKGVKAEIITVKSFDDLESKKDQLKGRIVFYDIPFDDTLINPFEAYGKYAGYRGVGPSRAAKYGAVAVMVRSMSNSTDNYPHTGSLRYNDSFPKIPAVAIGLRDVKLLSDLSAKGASLTAFIKTGGKFFPDTTGHNVIGEIKGSEFPNEYITIGGHLDSWDPAEGAHDDGAGCIHTIEVFRVLNELGYKPRHTIRFVLFANEENGLKGGNKYAEEAKAKGEKHIFALESDEGGFSPRGFGLTVPDSSWARIETWKKLFEPYHVFEWRKGGGGADIGPLARNMNTPVAGFIPDSQRYFDHHHAANDVFEAVNIRELKLGAVNIAALIYLIDKYGL
jgi:carboxypeptidase Q